MSDTPFFSGGIWGPNAPLLPLPRILAKGPPEYRTGREKTSRFLHVHACVRARIRAFRTILGEQRITL
jgi:hypothetical protein